MLKKYKNIFFAFLNVFALSTINTIKGGVIIECGYNYQFWIFELISLLLTISLLFFMYNTISNGRCTTIVRDIKDKVHDSQ